MEERRASQKNKETGGKGIGKGRREEYEQGKWHLSYHCWIRVTYPTALTFSTGMYNTPVVTLKSPTHCSFNVHINFIIRHYIIHNFN